MVVGRVGREAQVERDLLLAHSLGEERGDLGLASGESSTDSPDPGMLRGLGTTHRLGMQNARIGSLSRHDSSSVDEIVSFWIGEPAQDADALTAKLQRWFLGGETMDRLINKRFGAIVGSALEGTLDHWRASPRGRLALIILLDQFTRNLFRGTPRAYSGDRVALALALDAVDVGECRVGSSEERLALAMPLAHCEHIGMQALSVALARELVDDAPSALRGPLYGGLGHAMKYQQIIARFGRFPHRNAILGRTSTAEEIAFLEDEARRR